MGPLHVTQPWHGISHCARSVCSVRIVIDRKIGGGLPIKSLKENEITELNVPFPLDESQVKQLAGVLKMNTSLKEGIDLSKTNFTRAGATALGKALCVNKDLKTIALSSKGGVPTDLDVRDLRGDSKRNAIDLSNRGLKAGDAIVIAELMKKNKATTKLILRNNNVKDDGAKALAAMLQKNKTLKKLSLEKNGIGFDGGKALRDALLVDNKTLEQLNMYTNNIGTMKQAITDATSGRKFSIKA